MMNQRNDWEAGKFYSDKPVHKMIIGDRITMKTKYMNVTATIRSHFIHAKEKHFITDKLGVIRYDEIMGGKQS